MPSSDLSNRFVVRAKLLNEMQDAQARRLAAAIDQPPANAQDMLKQPDKLARAWNFSPSQNPAADFWAMHDQVLQQNMAKVPSDAPPEVITAAHNDAETQALNAVYPYRAELAGIGSRVLEDQVSQAERIKRIVEGRQEGSGDATPNQTAAPPVPGANDSRRGGAMS